MHIDSLAQRNSIASSQLSEAVSEVNSGDADDALRVGVSVIELLVVDTLIFCGAGPGPDPLEDG